MFQQDRGHLRAFSAISCAGIYQNHTFHRNGFALLCLCNSWRNGLPSCSGFWKIRKSEGLHNRTLLWGSCSYAPALLSIVHLPWPARTAECVCMLSLFLPEDVKPKLAYDRRTNLPKKSSSRSIRGWTLKSVPKCLASHGKAWIGVPHWSVCCGTWASESPNPWFFQFSFGRIQTSLVGTFDSLTISKTNWVSQWSNQG